MAAPQAEQKASVGRSGRRQVVQYTPLTPSTECARNVPEGLRDPELGSGVLTRGHQPCRSIYMPPQIRPEFRHDVLVFDPTDPVFGGPSCALPGCALIPLNPDGHADGEPKWRPPQTEHSKPEHAPV